ncbi:hypothetical protein LE191_14670 [Janthinobacterium sp. HSC-3S05]|uniref:hypothetical protein n=1 Tax=Janthinobacterium lividum TaxID=29581 RepID=UPI001CD86F26|nr:hypothetical protein [Janthinobacterium lividum]MCA1861351.1 hypothetical protein [Janthinobacterium lividum]
MTMPSGLAAPDNDAPVSPLAWLTLASLLVAGLAWHWFSSYAVPQCDDRETLAAVTAARIGLHDIKQAGYAWSQKTRGCLATVNSHGKSMQYAYTVSRVEGRRKSRIVYDDARPELIQARFGKIAWNGDFVQQAEPIGRDALLQAMLAGMDGLRGKPLLFPDLGMLLSPQHYREIADVEAVAPCRELRPGIQSCRLLVERNDIARMAPTTVWSLSVLQQSDFTFQRSKDGKNWSVTPQFRMELDQAQLQ